MVLSNVSSRRSQASTGDLEAQSRPTFESPANPTISLTLINKVGYHENAPTSEDSMSASSCWHRPQNFKNESDGELHRRRSLWSLFDGEDPIDAAKGDFDPRIPANYCGRLFSIISRIIRRNQASIETSYPLTLDIDYQIIQVADTVPSERSEQSTATGPSEMVDNERLMTPFWHTRLARFCIAIHVEFFQIRA
jgi:hypothetical protein